MLLGHINFVHIHPDGMDLFHSNITFLPTLNPDSGSLNFDSHTISCPFFKTIKIGLLKLLEGASNCQVSHRKQHNDYHV